MDYKVPLLLLSMVIFVSGCTGEQPPGKLDFDAAARECMNLCAAALQNGTSLADGPCLSNMIAEHFVCDVAHSPRDPFVDNDPANQCEAFVDGTIKHFVEVVPQCSFIRTV
jgi:hypothetical protein